MKHTMTRLTKGAMLFALLCALLCGTASADNPFTDVEYSDQYYNAVMWALESGVTAGTTASTFSPGSACNRGQVMTFLWRAAGEPEPAAQSNPFTDVSPDSYCYKAVLWAVQREITNGTSASEFSPANPCTYAHVLTFLWRSVGSPAPAGQSWYAGQYANQWYTNALAWAETSGILGDFDAEPGSPCPRAAIVSYLYRWAAPGSVLTLFPELKADKAEIPAEELEGTYRDGNVEFILEIQGDLGTDAGLLFIAQDAATGEPIAGFDRVSANIYQSGYDNGGRFTVGFFRGDGTVYLDYYRDGVHKGAIPRTAWGDENAGTAYSLSDYLGQYEEVDEFYPTVTIEPLGGEMCRITIQHKFAMWQAEGYVDSDTGFLIYTDGTYSERDRGGDWTVTDSGYSGALYFEMSGVLAWYDHNEEMGEGLSFVRSS